MKLIQIVIIINFFCGREIFYFQYVAYLYSHTFFLRGRCDSFLKKVEAQKYYVLVC